MGMFTTIIDPKTGIDYQIKSGYDDCETYTLGDQVNYWINPHYPNSGKLLDDVYEGYDYDTVTKQERLSWIVIKDHKVVAIEEWNEENGFEDYQNLIDRYQIQELPKDTWSEDVWKAYEEIEHEVKRENEEFLKSIEHLPENQKRAMIFARPLAKMFFYQSLAREMFTVQPLNIK